METTSNSKKEIKLFYSYSQEDIAFCQTLEKYLTDFRRQKVISDWHAGKIVAGSDQKQEIDNNLNIAHLILLLVSVDYLASDYCYNEMQRALERHRAGEAWVVPILVRSVLLDHTPLNHLQVIPKDGQPIESTTRSKDEAWALVIRELLQVIAKINVVDNKATFVPTIVYSSQIFDLPFSHTPFFTGREKLLKQIRTSFTHNKLMVSTQSISGLGGVGKTQLAVEYAHRYRQHYSYIFGIAANTSESLQAGFSKIAKLLKLPLEDEKDIQATINILRDWLSDNEGWLIVLDNADNLSFLRPYQSLLHLSKGHMLITTRATATGTLSQSTINIESMELDEASLFLLRRTKILTPKATLKQATPKLREDAEVIVGILDRFPLALDQVGAYLEEKKRSIASYVALYHQKPYKLLEERGLHPPGHPDSVVTTWSSSFQLVERDNPAAVELLRFCAFLHPDSIPIDMLIVGSMWLGPILKPIASDSLLLDYAISDLLRFSLVKRDNDGKDHEQLRMLKLMQVVLRNTMDRSTHEIWITRIIHVLREVCTKLEVTSWEECYPYILQVQNMLTFADEYMLVIPEIAHTCILAAHWLFK